jgi:hypothetical protein
MEWLNNFVKKHPIVSLIIPTSIGGLSFFGNLFIALSDGTIDTNEFHQLMSSANGFQTLLLLIVMGALRIKK